MSYEVDFWPHARNAVQITSRRDYIGEMFDGEEESIYMDTEDFFKIVEEYSEASFLRDAWKMLKDNSDTQTLELMRYVEGREEFQDIEFKNKER